MYLHIGNNSTVRKSRILGIFDSDNTTLSEATKDFLRRSEKEGKVRAKIEDIPKSFIVTESGEVYFSTLATPALINRQNEE